MILAAGCSSITRDNRDSLAQQIAYEREFKKICLSGEGKGRVEILANKQTFTYESVINKVKNVYHLALNFPIIGEREIAISLDPATANRMIKESDIAFVLKDMIGERNDRARLVKSVEEFFVFSSDFMRFLAAGVFPKHYTASFSSSGRFIMERNTASYRFMVESYAPNDQFFERISFKIFVKSSSTDPILTLFLVPETCDI